MQPVQGTRPMAANIACFAAMAFWAVGFPAGEILLETWGTVILIVIRLNLSILLLMAVWVYFEGTSAIREAPWQKAIFIGGTGFGFGAVLLLFGQKLSDPVTPAIAAAMMPISGAIIEVIMDGRKLRPNLIIGIILALTGGILAAGVQLTNATFGMGAFLCLLAVCIFAWGTRAATKDLHELTPIGQTTATLVGGMCFNLIVFVILWIGGLEGIEVGSLSGYNLMHLAIFAISSLAIAQFLWIWGAGKLGILLASFHMNAMPFYVMVFVLIFFGGSWNWLQALGAGLVALGVVIAQALRPGTAKPRKPVVREPEHPEPELQACKPFMWTGT